MASKEHKELAQYIKDVHAHLRKSTLSNGTDKAWHDHCENKNVLHKYAKFMEQLATTHWEKNCSDQSGAVTSRITWSANMAMDYFLNKSFIKYRDKEKDIAKKLNATYTEAESYTIPFKLLDVGSCYNPFRIYDVFDVLAIDLCPANDYVEQCDFLNVHISLHNTIINHEVVQLQEEFYDIITFCFLLEYIPTSELRIKACKNAYKLLKPGGLLIINTPDSKHVGANSRLIKCWRFTLAHLGFTRIKYVKFKHMHCMAFRKALIKDVAIRWAELHKETSMELCMNIPQDFNSYDEEVEESEKIDVSTEDFNELPFAYLE